MRLKTLRLFDFRNFEDAELELAERINFFVGDNGQGKTNLLEAVYVLARGSSFRPADARSLLKRDESGAAESAKAVGIFSGEEFEDVVEILLRGNQRSARLNGKRASFTDLVQAVPVVLFSPESLSAIKSGPEQRRQLADDVVLTQAPRQAKLLQEHDKCLRARNRLLRELAGGQGDARGLQLTLESLDKIYLLLCAHVTAARTEALRAVVPEMQIAMAKISNGDAGDISVEYLISDQDGLGWSESQIFDALQKRHMELARREIASGTSLVGPHKHDVRFLFREKDSRFYCSQGQQRALILSFKIAQIVYHRRVHQTYPILLLDDVLSELDAHKREGLMKFLDGISAQILMTATDLTWPEPFENAGGNSIFTVKDGIALKRSRLNPNNR